MPTLKRPTLPTRPSPVTPRRGRLKDSGCGTALAVWFFATAGFLGLGTLAAGTTGSAGLAWLVGTAGALFLGWVTVRMSETIRANRTNAANVAHYEARLREHKRAIEEADARDAERRPLLSALAKLKDSM